MNSHCRVLQIEDSVDDAFFNVLHLQREGMRVMSKRVETAAQMREALSAGGWDVILCDYQLPGFDSFGALELYKDAGLDIPFIVVSGCVGEAQAVRLIKAGAHDYVLKDDLAELGPAIRREMKAAEERVLRRRELASDALLASIVKDCNDAIFGSTLEGSLVSWNKGAEKLYGYAASEIIGGPAAMLESPDKSIKQSTIIQKVRCGQPVPGFQTVHLRKNKSTVEVFLTVSPVKEPHGRVIGTSTVAHDITVGK